MASHYPRPWMVGQARRSRPMNNVHQRHALCFLHRRSGRMRLIVLSKAMSPAEKQHRLNVYIAFALVYFFWGSTYLAIRVGVEQIPPALMAGARFLIAGVLMLVFCALSGRRVAISRGEVWRLATVGALLLTGGNVLLCWAEKFVPSGLAALIVAVVPLWVALIEGVILKGDRLNRRGWFGLALGFAGLAVLLWPQLRGTTALHRQQLIASGFLLLGALSWTIGSILSRRFKLSVGPISATGWEMTFAGPVNLMIAIAIGDTHHLTLTAPGAGAAVYLIILGSWVGFTASIWLLEHVPTPNVATYAYVNPIVAVFLGWLILHEHIDIFIGTGTVIIVAAVAIVTSSKLHRQPAEDRTLAVQLAAIE